MRGITVLGTETLKNFFFIGSAANSFSDSFGTYKHALLISRPLQTSFYKFFVFLLRETVRLSA